MVHYSLGELGCHILLCLAVDVSFLPVGFVLPHNPAILAGVSGPRPFSAFSVYLPSLRPLSLSSARTDKARNVVRQDKPPIWTAIAERAWQDSNLRHTAPETVALYPELQAHAKWRPPSNVTVRSVPLQRSKAVSPQQLSVGGSCPKTTMSLRREDSLQQLPRSRQVMSKARRRVRT